MIIADVRFRPIQTIGPVVLGESDGKVALATTNELGEIEGIIVLPIAIGFVSLAVFIIRAIIWWWASSDLKFNDLSKIIGIFSPFFGVVAEAIIK